MVQNNLQYNREQLEKARRSSNNSKKRSLASGFEYAVQPDGSVLGERRWRELQRRPHTCFTLYKPEARDGDRRLYQQQTDVTAVSLQNVENLIQTARQQYAQRQSLPEPRPPPPVPHQNPSQRQTLPRSISEDEPLDPPFRSPTRRIRNRHNAVYGQHLPTAQNSPALAGKVFGNQAVHQEERNLCQNLMSNGRLDQTENSRPASNSATASASYRNPPISTPAPPAQENNAEDEYDALLADIDVDQLVSERTQPSAPRSNPLPSPPPVAFHSSSNRFDYGTDWDRDSRGAQQRTSGNTFPAASSNRPFESNYDRPNDSFAVSSYADGQDVSFSSAAPSFNNDNSFAPASAMMPPDGSNSDGAPLCPGHSLPCQLLTSHTSTNMGRDFYKCSLPDDQRCDFFQWADGMEGNWNDNGGGGASVAGDVKEMVAESRRKFGHKDFRPGQRVVIENAIAGRDVFVLMPTGGGKSLCYQLPAWCCPGLSVVVSPLLSLIQDQVQSMSKLGVDSVFLASCQDYQTEQLDITRRLNDMTAHGGIKLLYITPEKLNNSHQMQSILRRLYSRNLISRFVVDEAHALSDWGHDFRPDYMKLNILRAEFPNVPLMALTATANEKVVNDAIRALGMRNEYRYVSSFNRPNLRYEVRKKNNKTLDAIADYIAGHPSHSGVIYCLSRKDCETVSEKLQEKVRGRPGCSRVRVSFYHAELDSHLRAQRHREWSNGIISVLCATIAFGMGIDKPDVRYVIHYSMPKSITHYYQESGRAGRDGDDADCILFYTYKDKKTLEHMIIKSSTNPRGQATRRKIDQLYTCVRYCEDEFRCRRTMQLEFFGENFDRSKCNNTCDNCRAGKMPDTRDLTDAAQTILRLLADVSKQKHVTIVQLMDLFRGSTSKSAVNFLNTSRLSGYGAGSKYKKFDTDRIAHALVCDRILNEVSEQNKGGFFSDYVYPGENAMAVQNGHHRFSVEFPREVRKSDNKENKKKAAKKKTKAKTKKSTAGTKSKKAAASSGAAKKAKVLAEPETVSIDDSDSDDDDLLSSVSRATGSRTRTSTVSVLPQDFTQELADSIKKLAMNWAEEERMYGKNVFYWNILSNEAMKAIAAEVPMTMDDLKAIGMLGENIVKEYGERIVKIVSSFVSMRGLEEYVNRRPAKRAKVGSSGSTSVAASKPAAKATVALDDGDEFDAGIDFGAIDLPTTKPAAKPSGSKKKSPYF